MNRLVFNRQRTPLIAVISVLTSLPACGGSSGQAVAEVSAPVAVVSAAAPTPTPSAAQNPSPSTKPVTVPDVAPQPASGVTPVASGSGVVSEGDSISVFWGGNHTGVYAETHPTMKFYGKAVGGSGLRDLVARADADIALKPRLLTVLIGANDLQGASGPRAWLDELWAYTARFKAVGIKVAVGTLLPINIPDQPRYTSTHTERRAVVNAEIRAAVGREIDAVIDFAADPVMGTDIAPLDKTLYSDGLHPTDGSIGGVGGQGKLALIYAKAVDAIMK